MSRDASHLTPELVEAFQGGRLPPAQLLDVDRHIAGCRECRTRLASGMPGVADFVAAVAGPDAPTGHDHLSMEMLSSLVDGTAGSVDRTIACAHLESCRTCAEELEDLRQFGARLDDGPPRDYSAGRRLPPAPHDEDVRPDPSQPRPPSTSGPFLRRPIVWAPAVTAAGLAIVWAVAQPIRSRNASLGAQLAQIRSREARLRATEADLRGQIARSREAQRRLRMSNDSLLASNRVLRGRTDRAAAMSSRIADLERAAARRVSSPPPASPGTAIRLRDGDGYLALVPQEGLVRSQPLAAVVSEALRTGRAMPPPAVRSLIGARALLLGAGARPARLTVVAPVGTAVRSPKPAFSWGRMPGANGYSVTVFDDRYNAVLESGSVHATRWTPERALEPGRTYVWQVIALRGGDRIAQAPQPPAPEARFLVLDRRAADRVEHEARLNAGSPLILGVLDEREGLLDDAAREFLQLQRDNPGSGLPAKLLRGLRALRG